MTVDTSNIVLSDSELDFDKLSTLQRELRDDLKLLVDESQPDKPATKAKVVQLIRRLNDTVERIEWSLHENSPEETRLVRKHPEIFGKLSPLAFTDRYAIAERTCAVGTPGLQRIFYTYLAAIARGTLERPRLCRQPSCGNFFTQEDRREIYCSVECRNTFHQSTASARAARSRARKA